MNCSIVLRLQRNTCHGGLPNANNWGEDENQKAKGKGQKEAIDALTPTPLIPLPLRRARGVWFGGSPSPAGSLRADRCAA